MKVEPTEAQWLHDHAELSWGELLSLSGLPAELLRALVDNGALIPLNVQAQTEVDVNQWRFPAGCVVAVRAVGRLREDFELDTSALSVALSLIERIHRLEARLQELQSQLPRTHGMQDQGAPQS